jgi:hypothetical protein
MGTCHITQYAALFYGQHGFVCGKEQVLSLLNQKWPADFEKLVAFL